MIWLLRLLLASLYAVPVLVTSSAPAVACSCAMQTRAEYAESAEAVIVATLLDDLLEGETGSVTAAAMVEHVYKGSLADAEITIETGAQGSACGLTGLRAGETVLFYGGLDGDVVSVDTCGGSTSAGPRERARTERVLGPGSPVTAEAGRRTAREDGDDAGAVPLWAWLVAGGVVAAGGSAVMLLRKHP